MFIEIQAQKKGFQIFELLEGAGVVPWLLFGQAVGGQSLWSSSGCSWEVGEGGELQPSPHLSAEMESLGSW